MESFNLKENICIANYTTIRVGGNAEYFYEPCNIYEFTQIINWAKLKNLTVRIIGGGSNLLIKNTYLEGLTICTKKLKSIKIDPETGLVNVECGVMLPSLAAHLAKNGCEGGEWSIGIPGTVGGAIFMNAGAANSSMDQNIESVQVIDLKTLKIFTIDKTNISFKYRYSSFQDNNQIILKAQLKFKPHRDVKIIMENTKKNLKYKKETQPYHMPSFGSVFKNPDNWFAGKLIEDAGLKGMKIGYAQISDMHANFIVNNSNATSKDIMELITLVQNKILQKQGILLNPEVRMIGFDYP